MSDTAGSRSRVCGVARLLRGWTIAVLAVLLAAGGHQSAHSIMHGPTEPIPWELLGFAIALTAPLAVALAGRRLATWATALTTMFGQVAFHGLYSLPYSGTVTSHAGHGHHGHHGHHEPVVFASSPHVGHGLESSGSADTVMLAAHVLAAALTTFSILRGERSLITLVSWLTLEPVRFVLAALPIDTLRPKPVVPLAKVWIPHPMNVAQTRSTRGPPVLA